MEHSILNNDGFFIVDNLFERDTLNILRESCLNFNYFEDIYADYSAINYTPEYCKNKNISNLVCNEIPKLLIKKYPFLCEYGNVYQRGWYFIHDNHQFQSVKRHRDPGSHITVNVWATPDEYSEDTSGNYNGFIIHTPDKSVTIPYKFNRTTIFFSQLEHESQLSKFKLGKYKRKVNFTFLFGPQRWSTKAAPFLSYQMI